MHTYTHMHRSLVPRLRTSADLMDKDLFRTRARGTGGTLGHAGPSRDSSLCTELTPRSPHLVGTPDVFRYLY